MILNKMHYKLKLVLFGLLISFQLPMLAQKRIYNTAKNQGEAPVIDGIIDEEAWDAVDWSGDFIQSQPYENVAPSQPTKFKLIYDDNNLYFAIRAYDSSPDSIVKRMSRRDGFAGDWVKVHLDSYHDLLSGFTFAASAAGVKGDQKISNNNYFDNNWDPIWYVKTSIDNEGWVAEMRIPLTQLRFGKQDEYVWGLQITRHLFRKDERSGWEFISPNASGWVHHFGEIHGIKNISPKRQKEITPYVVGKLENYEKDSENPFADGRDYDGSIGLDGKFGITNDLTLDFTINPDFGQVEADPSEVNLSTFETFFPEKRTFFIEGNNIFSQQILDGGGDLSSDNLFYSRRIGRKPGYWPEIGDDDYIRMPKNTTILGAVKLSGKTKNGLSVGILESITQLEQAEIAEKGENGNGFEYRKEAVEPFTNYFASKFEQDLNNSNTRIGVMATATNRDLYTPELKENMHSAAYSGGINFNHQWKNKTYYLNLNSSFSQVRGTQEALLNTQTNAPHFFQRSNAPHLEVDSSLTRLNGYGGTVQIGKEGNSNWRYTNWITFRSPGFNLNDMGYMRQNDEIQQVFWIQYSQIEPKSFYRNYNINFNEWVGTTFGFEYRYFGLNVNGHIRYKNYWCTGLDFTRDSKHISTEALRGGPSLLFDEYYNYSGHVGTDITKKILFTVGGWGGTNNNRTANENGAFLNASFQISNALKLIIGPGIEKRYDEIAYVSSQDDLDEVRYIRGTIYRFETYMTIRISYNITPDFTIEYYGMPFISTANYSNFKYITNSLAENFSDRFNSYNADQISYNESDQIYEVDENLDQVVDYSFDNPDFKVLDFNSNLVLRWEYMPGASLYLVWTQQRNDEKIDGNYSFQDDTRNLFLNTYPHDVFLVKFSYRFAI
jgi:hypothetical protein